MDQNEHIHKYLRDPLPDPDVPADDAWAGMSHMLDAAGAGMQAVSTGSRIARLWKSAGLVKGLAIITAAVVSVMIGVVLVKKPEQGLGKTNAGKTADRGKIEIRVDALPETITPEGATQPTNVEKRHHIIEKRAFTQHEQPNADVKEAASPSAMEQLMPLPGHFESDPTDLTSRVKTPITNTPPPARKKRRFNLDNIHFGPEWSLYLPVNGSEYLLTGADSIKRPARVAIPGFFISKNWNRHAATFIFTSLHTYFGNRDVIVQQVDTLVNNDSTMNVFTEKGYFIKSTGINFTLQYQFEATNWLSLSAGASYARFSRALLATETTSSLGGTIIYPLRTLKDSEAMNPFVRQQQWTVRAGLVAHPRQLLNGRIQIGANAILPVSNLSRNPAWRVRSANAQLFLRWMIW